MAFVSITECLEHTDLVNKGDIKTINMNTSSVRTALTISSSLLSMPALNLLIFTNTSHKYEIRTGEKGNLKLKCSGSDIGVCVLSLADEQHAIGGVKGYRVEIDLKCTDVCSGKFDLVVEDTIKLGSGIEYDIMPAANKANLRFELSTETLANTQKMRIGFVGSAVHSLVNKSDISVLGILESIDDFSGSGSKSFPMRRIQGNEIETVFYKNDAHFCNHLSKCKYTMQANLTNIWKVTFKSDIAERVEVIKEDRNYVLSV